MGTKYIITSPEVSVICLAGQRVGSRRAREDAEVWLEGLRIWEFVIWLGNMVEDLRISIEGVLHRRNFRILCDLYTRFFEMVGKVIARITSEDACAT